MEITTLAYMAGIIDGEGTIGGWAQGRAFSPHIRVANTNHRLIHFLQDTFGGHITPVKLKSARSRPQLHWHVSGQAAIDLARSVRPHLLLKARQADLIIALGELRYSYRKGQRGRVVLPEILAARVPLMAELRALNRRGIHEESIK